MVLPCDQKIMDLKIKVNKAKRNLPQKELEALPKDELVSMILKLEAHNKQLKNLLEKKVNPSKDENKRKQTDRAFDFAKFHKRHILLKFCYLGWDYEGFVTQENTTETIEFNLFQALSKVCLIESRETSNYNRCGRTDKGVSAFEQVISIDVRSKVKPDEQLSAAGVGAEINYCSLLNKGEKQLPIDDFSCLKLSISVLPPQIRAISWQPLATQKYSARFDCVDRTYKYFFPRGNLDIEKMDEACRFLIGSHDFRNLCKMDVGNGVVNYIRRLDSVEIKLGTRNHEGLDAFDMFHLEIKGSAFLWHMIRCIVAILMLVGQRKEAPEIVKVLLDVETNTKKPQYSLASEIPLNLFTCNFREDRLEGEATTSAEMLNKWIFDEETFKDVITDLQEHWCKENVKTTMIYEMLKVLHQEYTAHFPNQPAIIMQASSLNKANKRREYQPLMDRQKCSTLEDRIEHYTKKRRIVKADDADDDNVG